MTNISKETETDEMFLLFGDALALPYSPENEKKVNEALRIGAERLREFERQKKQPQ